MTSESGSSSVTGQVAAECDIHPFFSFPPQCLKCLSAPNFRWYLCLEAPDCCQTNLRKVKLEILSSLEKLSASIKVRNCRLGLHADQTFEMVRI